METLKYIGNNKPYGMLLEVEDKDVKRLLQSGNYKRLGEEIIEEISPNINWTEKNINEWIKKKGLNIDYNINKRTKKWALYEINRALGR